MRINIHRTTATKIGKLYLSIISKIHVPIFLFNIMYIIGLISVYMFASTILIKTMFQSTNFTPTKPISLHYLIPFHHI
jgi:hypothetical protein